MSLNIGDVSCNAPFLTRFTNLTELIYIYSCQLLSRTWTVKYANQIQLYPEHHSLLNCIHLRLETEDRACVTILKEAGLILLHQEEIFISIVQFQFAVLFLISEVVIWKLTLWATLFQASKNYCFSHQIFMAESRLNLQQDSAFSGPICFEQKAYRVCMYTRWSDCRMIYELAWSPNKSQELIIIQTPHSMWSCWL